ncbi:PREDICTED: putative pentatricopeptide repeat-containing protein At1g64310 [Nelumbo nucifera]|uniref:Pentatricopeptide repeat-containing protein At1g64310 n=2 Tax=Nelumbo nucifera TaxID=4432 RepID=A0A822YE69_NELNU|nr:PREDICTED: putative pentatricopeptide repeat-containing protein At1g64310 [Nelumbo nucifera]DAD30840.1 TPA_asm: hypothetical protein HUJ06_009691 [Nelumbo nucifera]
MCFGLAFLVYELSQSHNTLSIVKQLHALTIKYHLSFDPFYATKIIRLYALNNDLHSARIVFDRIPCRSVYLWNSIIRAYARAHQFNHALCLFSQMLRTEIEPDNFTFASVIRACSDYLDEVDLRVVHGRVIIAGLGSDSISSSALVRAYSRVRFVDEARRVFNGMPKPDLVMWNSMVSGYGSSGCWDKGLELFRRMQKMGERPDGYTMVGLLSGLWEPSLLQVGKGIHGLCLKNGFESYAHVGSALVTMYSRCGCLSSAYGAFNSQSLPDLVQWSALITGLIQSGACEEALLLFREMNLKGQKADAISIASTLAACARLAMMGPGREIHCYVIRHGFELEVMVSSALVAMYSKSGFAGLGFRVFKAMSKRNTIAYNSVISGLGSNGLASFAFDMFNEMLEEGFQPDQSTFSALLGTCCHAGFVKDGWDLLRRMEKEFNIEPSTEHYVYMVKLLGMAGEFEKAYQLIHSIPGYTDSGVWGALLSCCEVHGNSELGEVVAHRLFEIAPDKSAYRVMLSNIYASNGRWNDVKSLRDDMMEGGLRKMPGLSWT